MHDDVRAAGDDTTQRQRIDVRMHDDVWAAGDDVRMHDDVRAAGDDTTQRRGDDVCSILQHPRGSASLAVVGGRFLALVAVRCACGRSDVGYDAW